MALSTPRRRYLLRLGISMAIYLVTLFTGKYLVNNELADGPVIWMLGLLSGFAIIGAFYAIGMLIVETKDEFVRMLIVRQVLYGTGIALSLATMWGFLENFGLVEHVEAFWIAVIWFFGFGIGALFNRIKYGASGECL